MTVSCYRAVTGSWYSVRRNGRKSKVSEVKGEISAIKREKGGGNRGESTKKERRGLK
jgi:hypothetical protein